MTNEAKNVLEDFIEYLNTGDERIYDLIEPNNKDLKANIDEYLQGVNVLYQVKETKIVDENHYIIKTVISANGAGWNVNGFTTYYEIKLIGNEYKIIDTNIFNYIGGKNVSKFILKQLQLLAE